MSVFKQSKTFVATHGSRYKMLEFLDDCYSRGDISDEEKASIHKLLSKISNRFIQVAGIKNNLFFAQLTKQHFTQMLNKTSYQEMVLTRLHNFLTANYREAINTY